MPVKMKSRFIIARTITYSITEITVTYIVIAGWYFIVFVEMIHLRAKLTISLRTRALGTVTAQHNGEFVSNICIKYPGVDINL